LLRFSRNDDRIHPRILATRDAPESVNQPPSESKGRRECRALDAPVASRAKQNKAHERSHHGHTGFTRHSPRNGFNGFLRALLGDRAVLPPSPLRSLLLRNLTPASGRQDHTTSPSKRRALVSNAASLPSHPAAHVRDDRETPLCWDGMARN